jgi:hypothetical protein
MNRRVDRHPAPSRARETLLRPLRIMLLRRPAEPTGNSDSLPAAA